MAKAGICVRCEERPRAKKDRRNYRATCRRCHEVGQYSGGFRPSPQMRRGLAHKKPACERCGFVPEHRCQLDVDHIDGDRTNNDPSNFQTLCANCHRLKTQMNGDRQNRYPENWYRGALLFEERR